MNLNTASTICHIANYACITSCCLYCSVFIIRYITNKSINDVAYLAVKCVQR